MAPSKQLIEAYYAQKPDFTALFQRSRKNPTPEQKRQESPHKRKVKESLTQLDSTTDATRTVNMPVHPKEEEASGTTLDLTDQVAKESSDSTASTHEHHKTDTNATSGGVASMEQHKANPGPVMAENLGEPTSKDENKKRAAELNK